MNLNGTLISLKYCIKISDFSQILEKKSQIHKSRTLEKKNWTNPSDTDMGKTGAHGAPNLFHSNKKKNEVT